MKNPNLKIPAGLFSAILVITGISVSTTYSEETSDTLTYEEATTELDLDEEFAGEEVAAAFAPEPLLDSEDRGDSTCLDEYRSRKRQLLRRSLLHPLAIVPAAPAAAYVGLKAGLAVGSGISTPSAILGSSLGLVTGFYGASAIIGVHEAVQLIHYFDTKRMIALIEESTANPPIREGWATGKMLRKLERRGNSLSAENLQSRVRDWNATGELCDGRLRGHPRARKLRKKLVSFHRLAKILAR